MRSTTVAWQSTDCMTALFRGAFSSCIVLQDALTSALSTNTTAWFFSGSQTSFMRRFRHVNAKASVTGQPDLPHFSWNARLWAVSCNLKPFPLLSTWDSNNLVRLKRLSVTHASHICLHGDGRLKSRQIYPLTLCHQKPVCQVLQFLMKQPGFWFREHRET